MSNASLKVQIEEYFPLKDGADFFWIIVEKLRFTHSVKVKMDNEIIYVKENGEELFHIKKIDTYPMIHINGSSKGYILFDISNSKDICHVLGISNRGVCSAWVKNLDIPILEFF